MKQLILAFFLTIVLADMHSQSLGLSTLLSISTEKRLDKSTGLGIMYSQNLWKNHALGFSVCYKQKHSEYDQIYSSSAGFGLISQMVTSDSKSASLRLNYQYILVNREQAMISIGPEISYNFLWGRDNKRASYLRDSIFHSSGTYENEMVKKMGYGLLARFQINQVFFNNLSLCIDVRPEYLISNSWVGGEVPYSGDVYNLEFMIGFGYKLKGNKKNR